MQVNLFTKEFNVIKGDNVYLEDSYMTQKVGIK